MLIASGYIGDAESEDDSLLTGFGNWLFTRTINVLFGSRYRDSLVIFRAYRKDMAERLELADDGAFNFVETLFGIGPRKLSWELLMSARAARYAAGGPKSQLRSRCASAASGASTCCSGRPPITCSS